MIVYRVYKGWYDWYEHIGIFHNKEDAWVACGMHHDNNVTVMDFDFSGLRITQKFCRPFWMRGDRWTRYSIIEEEVL